MTPTTDREDQHCEWAGSEWDLWAFRGKGGSIAWGWVGRVHVFQPLLVLLFLEGFFRLIVGRFDQRFDMLNVCCQAAFIQDAQVTALSAGGA